VAVRKITGKPKQETTRFGQQKFFQESRRQLLSGVKEVEIFSDAYPVLAEVRQVQGITAHGDADDLLQFIGNQDPERVKGIFLVLGEHAVQKSFAERLMIKGFTKIECPAQHQEYKVPLPRVRKRIPIAARAVTE
jgi:predicted metal-dependent RNase